MWRHVARTMMYIAPLAGVLTTASGTAMAQEVVLRSAVDTVRFAAGRVATGDSQPALFYFRRAPAANIVAATVQVRTRTTRNQVLGLSVLPLRDSIPGAPVCQVEGFGPLLQCRIVFDESSSGSYVAMVTHAGGRGSIEFTTQVVGVPGPLVAGTSLSFADARALDIDRMVGDSLGYFSVDRGSAVLYRVDLGAGARDSVYVTLSPAERRALKLNVLDGQGRTLDEFDPTDAFTQRRVSRGGARTLFVLVRPADDRNATEPARYSIRVGVNPSAIQALAADGDASWSGTGAQQFDLRVPAGWSGVIALAGRGHQLLVVDSGGTRWPVESAFGGTTLGVRIGESWQGSPFVRHGVSRATRLTVDVVADPAQRYHSDWTLTLRGKRGSGISLVAFPPAAAEAWPGIWQATERTFAVTGGVRALMIPAPPDQFRTHGSPFKQAKPTEGGFRFGARLAGGAERFYDIAVTDEWGAVIDIADAGVFWQWPGDQERLAIVVFAQPGAPAQTMSMPVQLLIQSPLRPAASTNAPATRTPQTPARRISKPQAVNPPEAKP